MAYVPKALREAAREQAEAQKVAAAIGSRPSMFDEMTDEQKDMIRRLDILAKQICYPDAQRTNVGNFHGMFELGQSSSVDVANQLRSVLQKGTPEEKTKAQRWLVALGWTHVGGTLPT